MLPAGIPAYGATLLAELIYYPDNADGCQPYPSLKDRGGGSDLPLIVLSRRGSCYFVEKVGQTQICIWDRGSDKGACTACKLML